MKINGHSLLHRREALDFEPYSRPDGTFVTAVEETYRFVVTFSSYEQYERWFRDKATEPFMRRSQ